MGLSVATKTSVLIQYDPKPFAAFDNDWRTGFRDIQVQKCDIFVTQGQITRK